MAEQMGGQSLAQSATGGSLPAGQNPNPQMDIGGAAPAGGQTLAAYYDAPAGGKAGVDTSGRGFFTGPGGARESLANSAGAQKAGLVGGAPAGGGAADAGGAPIPGAVPPPSGLAPSGTLTPGPGQA